MNILGFESPKSLLQAIVGSRKTYYMNTLLLVSFLIAALNTLLLQVEFIEDWIWKPASGLVVLFVVLLVDFVLAVYSSVSKKEGFETSKATKFGVSVVFYFAILGIAFNIGHLSRETGGLPTSASQLFDGLAIWIYWFFIAVNFASILKHGASVGLIPPKMAAMVVKYIDIHKRFMKVEEKDTKEKEHE